jgi:hypothetical protein
MNVTFNNVDEYIAYTHQYGHNFYNHNIIRMYKEYQKIMNQLIKLKGDEWKHNVSYYIKIQKLTNELQQFGIHCLH